MPDVDATSYTVTARKDRPCDEYPERCGGIKAGEEYARHVAFPGRDCNQSRRPYVLCICRSCQTQYDRPMPPRRATKRKVRRG